MSIHDSLPVLIYFTVMAFIFGACMGSFLNCAAWRITHNESFIKGRSHCAVCNHELGAKDLVPLFSWLWLKGKCRYCGEKISARYPLSELCMVLLTVACLNVFDLSVLCLRNYVFICMMFLLTLTDIDEMMIPDSCHVISALVWAVTVPFIFDPWTSAGKNILAGFVFSALLLVISLILDKITGKDTLGGGDIKLIAVTGLYLGFIGNLFVVLISCLLGLVVMARQSENKPFPFGPWIAGAAVFMLLFGTPLINWYSGLLSY